MDIYLISRATMRRVPSRGGPELPKRVRKTLCGDAARDSARPLRSVVDDAVAPCAVVVRITAENACSGGVVSGARHLPPVARENHRVGCTRHPFGWHPTAYSTVQGV